MRKLQVAPRSTSVDHERPRKSVAGDTVKAAGIHLLQKAIAEETVRKSLEVSIGKQGDRRCRSHPRPRPEEGLTKAKRRESANQEAKRNIETCKDLMGRRVAKSIYEGRPKIACIVIKREWSACHLRIGEGIPRRLSK